jgi:hypothetical protein
MFQVHMSINGMESMQKSKTQFSTERLIALFSEMRCALEDFL